MKGIFGLSMCLILIFFVCFSVILRKISNVLVGVVCMYVLKVNIDWKGNNDEGDLIKNL